MDPRRGTSQLIIHGLLVVVCITLGLQACCALPVDAVDNDRSRRSAASGQEALTRRDIKTWALIRDLEKAVFNLKEHLLSVDATSQSSNTDETDTDVVDPLPETVQEVDRHMEESYPEVTSELQQRKKVDEEGSKTHKTSNGEEMSLKEALEFLVSMAKKKKKEEQRDHDHQLPHASHH